MSVYQSLVRCTVWYAAQVKATWKTECASSMPAARQYCLCFYLHHAMLAVGHQLCLTQAKLVQHACHMAANQRVVFVNPYREMTS